MMRQPKELQTSLFEEDGSPVELAAAQMADLVALVEALLREIATALANAEIGDEQDNG